MRWSAGTDPSLMTPGFRRGGSTDLLWGLTGGGWKQRWLRGQFPLSQVTMSRVLGVLLSQTLHTPWNVVQYPKTRDKPAPASLGSMRKWVQGERAVGDGLGPLCSWKTWNHLRVLRWELRPQSGAWECPEVQFQERSQQSKDSRSNKCSALISKLLFVL